MIGTAKPVDVVDEIEALASIWFRHETKMRRTLGDAVREILRLRREVAELEAELAGVRDAIGREDGQM